MLLKDVRVVQHSRTTAVYVFIRPTERGTQILIVRTAILSHNEYHTYYNFPGTIWKYYELQLVLGHRPSMRTNSTRQNQCVGAEVLTFFSGKKKENAVGCVDTSAHIYIPGIYILYWSIYYIDTSSIYYIRSLPPIRTKKARPLGLTIVHSSDCCVGGYMVDPSYHILSSQCRYHNKVTYTAPAVFERSEFLIGTPHKKNLRVCPRARVKKSWF